MSAYIVLLLAIVSRILPLSFHSVGLELTAAWGGVLYFSAKRPRWEMIFAIAGMALTDFFLSVFMYPSVTGYHGSFHPRAYLLAWAWYGVTCLIGSGLLRRVTALRVIGGVLASTTGFFLVSNFAVWMGGMYSHSLSGLMQCYTLALPFYRNSVISTAIVAGVLFGVPVLAARMKESAQSNQLQA